MRSWQSLVLVGLLVAVLGGAIAYSLWPEDGDAVSSAQPLVSDERQKSLAQRVEELELQQQVFAADAGVTALRGLVETGDGKPVPGAEVWVTGAAFGELLDALTCETCGASLYDCSAASSARELLMLARQGKLAPKVLASARADAQGRFSFESVPRGELTVHARAPGFGEGTQWADVSAEAPEAVVQLFAQRRTEVRVVDPDEHPVRGAQVAVFDRTDGTVTDAVTDDRGQFAARGDSAWIFVEAAGFLPQVLHEFYLASEVYDEGVADAPVIRLERPHRLRVETRLSGQLVDALVEVTGFDHPRKLVAKGGIAVFDDLPATTHDVTASYQTYVAPKQVAELGDGETVVRVDLRPAARLSVGVFDEKGEPVHGARVTVEGYGASDVKTTDDSGALLVFEQLAEGAYQVHVEADALRDAQRRVDLKPGDNHLEVTLQAASMLTGTVVDTEGKPVPNATVELVSQIHEAQATTTSDEGTFELQVDEAGAYRLRAREPQLGQVTKEVTAPAQDIVLKLDAMGRIEVHVTADKNPVKGAYVSVYGTGPSADDSGSAVSDERGLARLAGLQGGSYMVNVEQAGFQRVTPQMVKLQAGGKAEVTIALERGVDISGRVVDESGRPVANADVHTVGGEVKAPEGQGDLEVAANAFSDENGDFKLEGLKPGQTYSIAATAEDRATKAAVKVKAPGSGVTLKVEPLPGVKGRVIDEAGSPVAAFRIDGREFDTTDGRFTIGREADPEGKIYLNVDAEGFETLTVDKPFAEDLGDLRLKKAPLLRGLVVDASGQPVSGAEVTCDQCIDTTTSGSDGAFTLSVSQDSPEPTITASRLNHRGKTKLTGKAASVTVKLEPPVRVEGIVKDPSGRPVQARITVREINGAAEERLDSGPDGKFELDVPEGLWMFITRMSSTGQTVKVTPPKTFVTLGAPPGTCAVTITVSEPVGDAWLVPGEPERVPLEQLDDDALYVGAVALDLPIPNRPTRSAGLQCGVYTLITTDSSGVRRERVDVRASESTYALPPGPPETAAAGQP